MSVKIQLRRDDASVWTSENPILALGEPGFEKDTNQFKIGDGTNGWNGLDYMRQDFVSVVSGSGLADLTDPQQSGIKEGSLVLTTDGYRWFYSGSGPKTSGTSYVQMADVSPDWAQIVSRPASLLSIAGLTTGSGNYIYATASNVYTTGVITDFGRSLVDDTNASGARITLGSVIGTDVQAYNTTLAQVVAGTYTGSSSITSVGTLSNLTTTDPSVSLAGGATTISTANTASLTLATNNDVSSANIILVSGGNVNINSYGSTGYINLRSSVIVAGSGTAQANIISNGNYGLLLAGNSSTVGANILLDGTTSTAHVRISPLGSAGGIIVGNGTAQANIISSGNYGLLLAAASGTGANILIFPGPNGNVDIRSLGTGNINLKSNVIVVGNGTAQANIISSGNYGLLLAAASGTGANILISPGASGNVNINSLGAGNLHITAGTTGHAILTGGGGANIVIHGGNDSPIQINSIGAGNVNIKAGSSGTVKLSGGSTANILIEGTASNANIRISPLGTGVIIVGNGAAQANIISNGNYGLLLAANSSTTGANILIEGTAAYANIIMSPAGSGMVIVSPVGYGSRQLYVTGSIIEASAPSKTLYFKANQNFSYLHTTENWYLDRALTIPAGFLPGVTDTVVVEAATAILGADITFKSMILLGAATLTVGTAYTLRSDIYFYNNSLLYGANGSSISNPDIIGNLIFRNTSTINTGFNYYINGNITFYDSAKPSGSCNIYANNIVWTKGAYGDISTVYYAKTTTFDNSLAVGHFVGGTVITNGTTEISSNTFINGNTTLIVNDNATFVTSATVPFENTHRAGTSTLILNNDPTATLPTTHSISTANPLNIIVNSKANNAGSFLDNMNITSSSNTTITFNNNTYLDSVGGTFQVDKLIFNHQSYNDASFTTYGSMIFNDSSYNNSSATTHRAIFNDTSHNDASLGCDYAIFNHDSYNNTTTLSGSGNATFYNNSQNRGTITNGIFHDFSSNISGATINSTGIFYDFSSNAGTISGSGIFPLVGH